MADLDFDGCARACRKAGAHTLVWGQCEHAPEPEPRLSVLRQRIMGDGHPSIVTETIHLSDLADRIEAALRTVNVRLGPNALHILEAGGHVGLSGGEYRDMALMVAKELISDAAPDDAEPEDHDNDCPDNPGLDEEGDDG